MNNVSNAYNYNDLAGLNSITQTGKTDEAQALKEVARQFESMFVNMMLKSMREANEVFGQDNPLNTNESKFYQQMFDDQLALSLSKGKGMGLADTLYRQMKSQFDIKEKQENDTQPQKIMPLNRENNQAGQNNVLNPFSSLHPNLKIYEDVKSFQLNTQDKNIKRIDVINSIEPSKSLNAVETLNNKTPTGSDKVKVETLIPAHLKVKNTVTTDVQASKIMDKKSDFKTPQDFVETLWPIAQKVGKAIGVEPKAILAQAALETGWGKHIIHQGNGESSHNLFGIKADKRWQGDVAKVSTLEYRQGIAKKEVAPFRVYDSYEKSLNDYGDFIKNSHRYKSAIKDGSSIKNYSEGLQKGGYATDPNYANKIQRIAAGDVLNNAINQAKRG